MQRDSHGRRVSRAPRTLSNAPTPAPAPGSTPVSRRTWTSGSQRRRAKREAAEQAERQEEQRRIDEKAVAEKRQRDAAWFGRRTQRDARPTPEEVLEAAKEIFASEGRAAGQSAFAAGVDAAMGALDFADAPWLDRDYRDFRMARLRELQHRHLSHLLSRHGNEVTRHELIQRCFQHRQPEQRAQRIVMTGDNAPKLRRQPPVVSAFLSDYSMLYAEYKLLSHPSFDDLARDSHERAMELGRASDNYIDDLTVEIRVPLVTVFPRRADLHLHGYRRVQSTDGMWHPAKVSFAEPTEWELYGRFIYLPDRDGKGRWEPVTIYPTQIQAIRIARGVTLAPGEEIVRDKFAYLQQELDRVTDAGQPPHPDNVGPIARDLEHLALLAQMWERHAASAPDRDQVVEIPPL